MNDIQKVLAHLPPGSPDDIAIVWCDHCSDRHVLEYGIDHELEFDYWGESALSENVFFHARNVQTGKLKSSSLGGLATIINPGSRIKLRINLRPQKQ